MYRNIRSNPRSKLVISITAALILLYSIYIGAVYAGENDTACTVLSAFFHYAFLVVLFTLFGSILYTVISVNHGTYHNYPSYMAVISFGK